MTKNPQGLIPTSLYFLRDFGTSSWPRQKIEISRKEEISRITRNHQKSPESPLNKALCVHRALAL